MPIVHRPIYKSSTRIPLPAKQDAPLVRCGCQTIASPACASLARSVPWKSGLFNAESAATAERAERIRTYVSRDALPYLPACSAVSADQFLRLDPPCTMPPPVNDSPNGRAARDKGHIAEVADMVSAPSGSRDEKQETA